MSYPKLILKAALATVAGLGIVTSSWGGSATANLNVSATVVQTCTITTTPVAFNNYDPLGTQATNDLTATGTVALTCTKGSLGGTGLNAVTIGLDNGGHFSSPNRQMADVGATNFLTYELYQPNGTTPSANCTFGGTVWNGANLLATTSTSWGIGSPQSFKVCGKIAQGLDPAQGVYADTVVATVNF